MAFAGNDQTAKTCLTRSAGPPCSMASRRAMFGCLPGLARSSSACSAKISRPFLAASAFIEP